MSAAKKPLKRYTIKHQGTEIVIETESSKNNSILALLRLLAREIKKSKPELWDDYVKRVNQVDRHPETDDPKEENFDFFERLMQKS